VVSRKERVSWFVLRAMEDPLGRTEGTARAGAVRVLVGLREKGLMPWAGPRLASGTRRSDGVSETYRYSACPEAAQDRLAGLAPRNARVLGELTQIVIKS